jgi:hypothetical protein
MQRRFRRVLSVLAALARWYATPTGFVLLAGLVAGVVVALGWSVAAGIAVITATVAVIVPYKLHRLDRCRVHLELEALQLHALNRQLGERLSARIATAEQRTTGCEGQVQQARRDLLGSVGTVRDEFFALMRSERMVWTKSLAGSIADVTSSLGDDVTRIGTAVERLEARFASGLDEQQRRHHLAAARRDARNRHLGSVLLMICAQRVGSTWLFDLLRHHVAIEMFPTADVYRRLAISGRRYPAHLTGLVDDGLDIEVQDAVGGLVPSFRPDPWSGESSDSPPTFAIEKVHPSAIGFDAEGFVRRVETLRSDLGGVDRVVPIFMIREPRASIRSFIAYRTRAPEWHRDVPVELAHDFYRRSYETIAAIHERLPGMVVGYENLAGDPVGEIARVLVTLGLAAGELDARRSAVAIVGRAERVVRPSSAFFNPAGAGPDATSVELGVATGDPGRAQAALATCRDVCRRLSASTVDDSSWIAAES